MTIKEYIDFMRKKYPECKTVTLEMWYGINKDHITELYADEYTYTFDVFKQKFDLSSEIRNTHERIKNNSIYIAVDMGIIKN